MTVAAPPLAATERDTNIQRWRRRSRLIRALRIALPLAIGLIFATLAGFVAKGTISGGPSRADQADAPIRLVNFRLVGRDDKGRAFVLTAASATRDQRDYQRVVLDRPSLTMDAETAKPTILSAKEGELHEATGKLELRGGVTLDGAELSVATARSVFDIATGALTGQGDIAGQTPLGEVNARSYGVYDEGARMVFKGGVRGRIESK